MKLFPSERCSHTAQRQRSETRPPKQREKNEHKPLWVSFLVGNLVCQISHQSGAQNEQTPPQLSVSWELEPNKSNIRVKKTEQVINTNFFYCYCINYDKQKLFFTLKHEGQKHQIKITTVDIKDINLFFCPPLRTLLLCDERDICGYYISPFFIVFLIQLSCFSERKEYTPGFLTAPQGGPPKDVIPTRAPLHNSGPPESPWREWARAVHKLLKTKCDVGVFTPCVLHPHLTGVCLLISIPTGTYHASGNHRVQVVVLAGVARGPVDHGHVGRHQDVWLLFVAH